jgi:hypothetical protein
MQGRGSSRDRGMLVPAIRHQQQQRVSDEGGHLHFDSGDLGLERLHSSLVHGEDALEHVDLLHVPLLEKYPAGCHVRAPG